MWQRRGRRGRLAPMGRPRRSEHGRGRNGLPASFDPGKKRPDGSGIGPPHNQERPLDGPARFANLRQCHHRRRPGIRGHERLRPGRLTLQVDARRDRAVFRRGHRPTPLATGDPRLEKRTPTSTSTTSTWASARRPPSTATGSTWSRIAARSSVWTSPAWPTATTVRSSTRGSTRSGRASRRAYGFP